MPEPSAAYLIDWLASWFRQCGRDTAVVGVSGGKDSAIVAALCVKALGKNNVFGVMLPNGSAEEIDDARQVCAELGINFIELDIKQITDTVSDGIVKELQRVNQLSDVKIKRNAMAKISARLRMTILYAVAQALDEHGRRAAVVGSGNKSKTEAGFVTKWGDSACDVNPLLDVWVNDLPRIADELGCCPRIVRKPPKTEISNEPNLNYTGVKFALEAAFSGGRGSVGYVTASDVVARYMSSRHKRRDIPHPVFSGEYEEEHASPIATSKDAKQEADRLRWANLLCVSEADLLPGAKKKKLPYPQNLLRDVWLHLETINPRVYAGNGYFPPPTEMNSRLARKLEAVVNELGERQRYTVFARYRDGKPASAVAEELGVSKSRVRQWTGSAIAYLSSPENFNRIMITG